MSMMPPSPLARRQRRWGIPELALAALTLGAAAPCRAQDSEKTNAAVAIVEPPDSQIAADFVGKSGVALSVLAPHSGSSSLALAVTAAPSRAELAAQGLLLTPAASSFRSLIPLGAVVSILDSRLLFDYAEIYGSDNVILVMLQYN